MCLTIHAATDNDWSPLHPSHGYGSAESVRPQSLSAHRGDLIPALNNVASAMGNQG